MSDQILTFRGWLAANPTRAEAVGAAAVVRALDRLEEMVRTQAAELAERGRILEDERRRLSRLATATIEAELEHQAEITALRLEIDRLTAERAYSDGTRRARSEGSPVPVAAAIGITQQPPPPGPRRGTRIAASVYLPFGTDPTPIERALEALGYDGVETRPATHVHTRTRVTATRVVTRTVTEAQAQAAIWKKAKNAAAVDVQVWPAF